MLTTDIAEYFFMYVMEWIIFIFKKESEVHIISLIDHKIQCLWILAFNSFRSTKEILTRFFSTVCYKQAAGA